MVKDTRDKKIGGPMKIGGEAIWGFCGKQGEKTRRWRGPILKKKYVEKEGKKS